MSAENEGVQPEPELDLGLPQQPPPNYIDSLADDIGLALDGRSCSSDLLRLYALLALVKGTEVTLEDVHNAWAVWRAETKPGHPALVTFGDLSPETQALDIPYRDAIRKLASPVELDPEPEPRPAGEYARVEVMGHVQHTGWVSDGNRAGVAVLVIRDWDNRVVAEVPGASLYRFVPLPTPLKRPEARPAAITGGSWADWDSPEDSAYDDR